MRTLPAVLLLSLAACSPEDEDTAPVDTSDDSGVDTDTSDTDDTDSGDTADTGDTSDSGDTGAESSSPYANCEEVGVSTDGYSWVNTYDALGQRTGFVYDGGSYVNAYAYTWDDDGHVVQEDQDYGNDGTIDLAVEYEYDERDNWVAVRNYTSGTLTASQTREFTYHSDGSVTIYKYDVMSAPVVLTREEYTYDERGNVTRYVFDNLDDGVLDYDFWYAYT